MDLYSFFLLGPRFFELIVNTIRSIEHILFTAHRDSYINFRVKFIYTWFVDEVHILFNTCDLISQASDEFSMHLSTFKIRYH